MRKQVKGGTMTSFDTDQPADNWDDFVPEHQREQLRPMTPEEFAAANASQRQGSARGPVVGGGLRRLIGIPIFLVIAAVGWIANYGTTVAEDLVTGDCFVMPAAEEFERLDTESCDAPHDGQIIGVVNIPGPALWPDIDALDPYWFDVMDACQERFNVGLIRTEALPADLEMFFFFPTPEGWQAGDRESLCYIYSTGGLDGSFVG